MNIVTNNHSREMITYYDLPEAVRNDFDYVDEDERADYRFFKYRGCYYDSREFIRIIERRDTYNGWATQVDNDSPLLAWDGIQSDSYFSGIVVKHTDEDSIIVGHYYS